MDRRRSEAEEKKQAAIAGARSPRRHRARTGVSPGLRRGGQSAKGDRLSQSARYLVAGTAESRSRGSRGHPTGAAGAGHPGGARPGVLRARGGPRGGTSGKPRSRCRTPARSSPSACSSRQRPSRSEASFGFIFGIPRALAVDPKEKEQREREREKRRGRSGRGPGHRRVAARDAPNTNLEEISDWLHQSPDRDRAGRADSRSAQESKTSPTRSLPASARTASRSPWRCSSLSRSRGSSAPTCTRGCGCRAPSSWRRRGSPNCCRDRRPCRSRRKPVRRHWCRSSSSRRRRPAAVGGTDRGAEGWRGCCARRPSTAPSNSGAKTGAAGPAPAKRRTTWRRRSGSSKR